MSTATQENFYSYLQGLNKPVSRLIQGTVMISAEGVKEGDAFELLDSIYELGCTTFDTAHVYDEGANETRFGRWLASRDLRDKVVIIGKGAHHNAWRKRVTPYDISSDLHDSLARFGLEHIDIYLLHRDDPSQAVGPIVDVLNKHADEGKITLFGGSNWSHERIEAANVYAERNHLRPFCISSPNFSLAKQIQAPWPGCISISHDQAAKTYYQCSNMPLFTWSSLAGGFFSGRFERDNLDSFSAYLDKVCISSYCYEENFERLARAKQLAEAKQVSLAQIAMAYVLNYPLNIFALVGCQNSSEFAANMKAASIHLSAEEITALSR